MSEGFSTSQRRLNHEKKSVFDFFLSEEVNEACRAEADLKLAGWVGGDLLVVIFAHGMCVAGALSDELVVSARQMRKLHTARERWLKESKAKQKEVTFFFLAVKIVGTETQN